MIRVDVECGGAVHHVLWHRGSLVIEDHDVPAELALHRLGGERPACIEVYETWRSGNVAPTAELAAGTAGLVAGIGDVVAWVLGGSTEPAGWLPEELRALRMKLRA